ncbi:hypothetical protein [Bradyrhizobium sp. 2TAF24]|uniref:hypothetical protein n=1 Tax=Bradyrhizobium sp. 2TAF24 TaxID=3233011 RepID=UPI003F8E1F7F
MMTVIGLRCMRLGGRASEAEANGMSIRCRIVERGIAARVTLIRGRGPAFFAIRETPEAPDRNR